MPQELCIMDVVNGDIRVEWDRDIEDEVKTAKKAFNGAKKKGYLLYKTDRHGGLGEQLAEFDPKAEKIIGVPRLVGG